MVHTLHISKHCLHYVTHIGDTYYVIISLDCITQFMTGKIYSQIKGIERRQTCKCSAVPKLQQLWDLYQQMPVVLVLLGPLALEVSVNSPRHP